jgi:uncharacterized protein (TIGR03790 family)
MVNKFFVGLLLIVYTALALAQAPQVILPRSGLVASDLAVVVNSRDPLSIKIANYYQQQRQIPAENIISIEFDVGASVMSPVLFARLIKRVEQQTPTSVQAYVLTWAAPYRVGCMSISAAFAFGYDKKYCASGCKATAPSFYADSNSLQPYQDFAIRPTMLLAAENFAQAKALIDRGVAADGNAFKDLAPTAYLVETPDKNRSVRKAYFPRVADQLGSQIQVKRLQAKSIQQRQDVMFYFTGAIRVPDIESNRYMPGAMADHLTSTGGQLTDSRQMSALRWLEAGATGSYGTVVEPCNLLTKFPNPLVAINRYLQGASLLEAYWKSVVMPGQGVFIGEPLAKPYANYYIAPVSDGLRLTSPVLLPGFYKLLVADQLSGPFTLLRSGIELSVFQRHILLSKPYAAVYKIERLKTLSAPSWPTYR